MSLMIRTTFITKRSTTINAKPIQFIVLIIRMNHATVILNVDHNQNPRWHLCWRLAATDTTAAIGGGSSSGSDISGGSGGGDGGAHDESL